MGHKPNEFKDDFFGGVNLKSCMRRFQFILFKKRSRRNTWVAIVWVAIALVNCEMDRNHSSGDELNVH